MPTLSETFEKRVVKPDYKEIAEQRNAVIENLHIGVHEINQALDAVKSDTRFKLAHGRSSSILGLELRKEWGDWNTDDTGLGRGVRGTHRMMYIDFDVQSGAITICTEDWGEFPDIKTDPEDVYTRFSLDAAQGLKEAMVDDMMNSLSDKDKYELKIYFAAKRQDQQAVQHAALK